jgi:hypothetical protein
VASQQAITAVGGLMQNPCGNADASLLFETSTDFGSCADQPVSTGTGVPAAGAGQAGGTDTGVASQQAITAVGGLMQNPCGSADASLLFQTSTDFGSCADQPISTGAGAGGSTGPGGGVHPIIAGAPTVNGTAVTGGQAPSITAGGPLTVQVSVTNQGTETLTGVSASSSQGSASVSVSTLAPGQSATVSFSGTAGTGSQRVQIVVRGVNAQGATVTLTVTINYVGATASAGTQATTTSAGTDASASAAGTDATGTVAVEPLNTAAPATTSANVPAAGASEVLAAGSGNAAGTDTGVASQQAITAVGGLMQNPCGNADASLLFETSTDFGSCADQPVSTGTAVPGAGSGQVAGTDTGVASQQAITAVGGLMQNPCGNTAASLLFETSTDFGN